ncbi:MAG: NADH:ubiquinone reductase (Na(+)-transporting) subunit B, partial [Fibrobacterales bacterium]
RWRDNMRITKDLLEKPADILMNLTKEGPFKKMHAMADALDTLIRTPNETTSSRVHVRDALDSKRMMSLVIMTIIPCLLFAFYNVGFQKLSSLTASNDLLTVFTGIEPTIINSFIHGMWAMLPIVIVTYMTGSVIEVIFGQIRGHEVNEGFFVTGMLLPLTLAPTTPLWVVAVGTAFGVIIGKEVFGGSGMNFLNPALTARAFIFFSYPTFISGDGVWRAINTTTDKLVDAYSGATPLLVASQGTGAAVIDSLNSAGFTFSNLFLGFVPGSAGETSALLCLLGALVLVFTRLGSGRIMLGTLVGSTIVALIFNAFAGAESNSLMHLPFYYHWVMGGFAFGAAFMATDPVSASGTNTGKWVYGALIGALAVIIRVANPAYPEGMMLAILFMNVFAPLIDHYVIQGNIKRRLARAGK